MPYTDRKVQKCRSQNKMKQLRNLFCLKQKEMICVGLVLLIIFSALSVVFSTYKSRQLFSELEQSHRHEIYLEEVWGRLLLEQSTWASRERIEDIAITKLTMKIPDSSDIKVVR